METMKALLLQEYGNLNSLEVKEVPIPTPQLGEVLVRMDSSPFNPSDSYFLQGNYLKPEIPCIPGIEGSGTVVGSGGGMLAWTLQGARVALISDITKQGTWAEYTVAKASHCVKLPSNVSFEEGSSFFVNPMTCALFIEIIQNDNHKAVVQTAASSALGKMLIRWCLSLGITLLNVVRREEQVKELQAMGCQYVFNSSSPSFKEDLKQACEELRVTVGFDAVGGEMTGTIVNSVCEGSSIYIYGALSGEGCSDMNCESFLFQDKTLSGLYLNQWLDAKNGLARWTVLNNTVKLLPTILKTDISRVVRMSEVKSALQGQQSTPGKTIVKLSQP